MVFVTGEGEYSDCVGCGGVYEHDPNYTGNLCADCANEQLEEMAERGVFGSRFASNDKGGNDE